MKIKEFYSHDFTTKFHEINVFTSIYDLVLQHVCHFHHHFLQLPQLPRYSCLYLGSCIHEFCKTTFQLKVTFFLILSTMCEVRCVSITNLTCLHNNSTTNIGVPSIQNPKVLQYLYCAKRHFCI